MLNDLNSEIRPTITSSEMKDTMISKSRATMKHRSKSGDMFRKTINAKVAFTDVSASFNDAIVQPDF